MGILVFGIKVLCCQESWQQYNQHGVEDNDRISRGRNKGDETMNTCERDFDHKCPDRKFIAICLVPEDDCHYINRGKTPEKLPSASLAGYPSGLSDHSQLFSFYDVDNVDALVEAQEAHIKRLQAKIEPGLKQPITFGKVREG